MKRILLIALLITSIGVYGQQEEKTYKLLASCGTCNFNMPSETGCALAVQIAGKHYWVDGSKLHDHGDPHDKKNGMCRHARKAEAVGYIDNDKLVVTSFVLLDEKKKKKNKK